MNRQTTLLIGTAGLIMSLIWFAAPQLEVMLNEPSTELIGINLSIAAPIAPTSKPTALRE